MPPLTTPIGYSSSLNLSDLRKEIEAGLPNERQRRDDSLINLKFYAGDFSEYPPIEAAAIRDGDVKIRTSKLMSRIVDTLTANLYRDGPKRTLVEHDAASEWLANIYKRNCIDAQLQQADRLCGVTDVTAIQVEPTEDERCPVRFRLWDGSQFCTYASPDDPLKVAAIAVLDQYDHQRRCRLWTPESVSVYTTEKYDEQNKTAGATAFTFRGSTRNPYGFIPFSYVHWHMPVCEFWNGGPGTHLRLANDAVNWNLTNTGRSVVKNLVPVTILQGVREDFKPVAGPGVVWNLPPSVDDVGEAASPPDAHYLQADASFVGASWDDIQQFVDHTLEMAGVPPATVRMTQDSARSGVSIIAEHAPLVLWAQSRQRPFAHYEESLARITLAVGARYLGVQEGQTYRATAADLDAAAVEPNLALRWPGMYPSMPGLEQDQGDQWLLDNRLASRTTILMRRDGYTREEAEAYLEEVAADLEKEQSLFEALRADRQEEAAAQTAENMAENPSEDTDEAGDDTRD